VLQGSGIHPPVLASTPSSAAATASRAVSARDSPSKCCDAACKATFPQQSSLQAGSAVMMADNNLLSNSTLPVQGDPCQEPGAGSAGGQSSSNMVQNLSVKDLGWESAHLPASPPAAKNAARVEMVHSNSFPIHRIPEEAAQLVLRCASY
jgi:hypothetical protein